MSIEILRAEIDHIHDSLRDLLIQRRDLALKIWSLKKDQNLPLIVPEREQEILESFVSGPDLSSDPEFQQALTHIMQSVLREYRSYLISRVSK
ncbi:chorismate mutase [Bdellovibrio bacteriovorus]|uniref:chorismate mutase n=1 Tax=Bdellovibrio bacteriovorus TaxID=959 RepID=A0A150WUF7_BDEBC|nr:chorismate mutase [Bdellovibrio bacteriovorus]KYG70137.1 hypothetical protein AZI85_15750 [Bdellovibrio bacteriovorus]